MFEKIFYCMLMHKAADLSRILIQGNPLQHKMALCVSFAMCSSENGCLFSLNFILAYNHLANESEQIRMEWKRSFEKSYKKELTENMITWLSALFTIAARLIKIAFFCFCLQSKYTPDFLKISCKASFKKDVRFFRHF